MKNELSLERIISAGTPYTGLNAWMFVPRLIQYILSSSPCPLETVEIYGTPKRPFDELLDKMVELGGRCVLRDDNNHFFLWDNHSYTEMHLSESSDEVGLSGNITDPALKKSLDEVGKEFISQSKSNLVFCIIKMGEELQIKSMGNGSSPLIEDNYTSQVVADYRYVVEAFKCTPSIGRIAILNGEPGTGKTHLIRSFLSELDVVFLIVPSNLLEVLDKPEFMPLLLDVREDYGKPIIMIIEDGDLCLVPRETDNISSIASLLNLSDGILGSMLDVKMIISTNAHIKDMDEAILRPGRLCKQINVAPLSERQANEVYRRLCEDDGVSLPDRKEYTLAEVYEFFNTKDIKVVPPVLAKRAIGFARGT